MAETDFPPAILAGEAGGEVWWGDATDPPPEATEDLETTCQVYVRGDLVKQLIESAWDEVGVEEGMRYGPTLDQAVAAIPAVVLGGKS